MSTETLTPRQRADRACIRFAVEQRAKGRLLRQIGADLDVSEHTVGRLLRTDYAAEVMQLRGLQFIPVGTRVVPQNGFYYETRHERIRLGVMLRAKGQSLNEIGSKLHIDHSLVRRDLRTDYAQALIKRWGLRWVNHGSRVLPEEAS